MTAYESQHRGVERELNKLVSSIQLSPIATAVSDCRLPDNPLDAVNERFLRLTGYAADEILGRNCRFLSGPDTEPENRARVRRVTAEGGQGATELTNYRKDGSKFRNALMIAPILDENGQPAFFIGSQMAVQPSGFDADYRQQEAKSKTACLSKRQKEVLTLMASGHRKREIGEQLGISEKTVEQHRSLTLRSLEAQTSSDAIRVAVEAGFVGSTNTSLPKRTDVTLHATYQAEDARPAI